MALPRGATRPLATALLIAAASAFLSAPAEASGSASGARTVDRFTPLVQSVMSKPRWFRDAEGRVRMVYELKLTNGIPVPVTVSSVSVRDVGRRRTIERLSGADLLASMTLLASPTEPATTVPGSGIGVVWMDVVVPSRRRVPQSIRHRLTVAVPPGLPVPSTITDVGGFARVDRRPPVVLGPPLDGPGWVAVGSCCDGPHRRSVQPVNGKLYLGQRFAIDWNGVDAQDRFVVGDPALNSSWTFYDKPVLAVADARVVAAVDRFPDQIPNDPRQVTIREADGNYVILALGQGRFAFYAHLKPGSVRVKRGQRVREGQVVGRLGNSGSSTGPHLHFHVMDRPSALASDGLPYVFDRFRTVGRIPPLDDSLAATLNAGNPVPIDPAGAGPHRRELPLGRDVVDFPPADDLQPRLRPGRSPCAGRARPDAVACRQGSGLRFAQRVANVWEFKDEKLWRATLYRGSCRRAASDRSAAARAVAAQVGARFRKGLPQRLARKVHLLRGCAG